MGDSANCGDMNLDILGHVIFGFAEGACKVAIFFCVLLGQ